MLELHDRAASERQGRYRILHSQRYQRQINGCVIYAKYVRKRQSEYQCGGVCLDRLRNDLLSVGRVGMPLGLPCLPGQGSAILESLMIRHYHVPVRGWHCVSGSRTRSRNVELSASIIPATHLPSSKMTIVAVVLLLQ